MSLRRLKTSFLYAFRGLKYVLKTEQNFRIHTLCAFVVLILAFYLNFSDWKMVVLILLVMVILTVEMINTALERLTDLLKPRLNHYVSLVKDIMAGAVFLTVCASLLIGVVLFAPYLVR